MTRHTSEPDAAASLPTQRPTHTPTTYAPSAAPTTAPTTTFAPTVSPSEDDNGTALQETAAVADTETSPHLLFAVCALVGVVVLLVCVCSAWKKRRQPVAAAPVPIKYALVVQQSAPVCTTDPAAERLQVDTIRAHIAGNPNPDWRLADVAEEDIDMEDMPKITAIHYGMSPSETLEGDTFKSVGNDDDDDDEATLVLEQ